MGDYVITVTGRGMPVKFNYHGTEHLLDALTAQEIYVSAACGDRGTCGKCRVQVLVGSLEITAADRRNLSELELKQGYRLACKAYPKENCTIRIAGAEESDFEAVAMGKTKLQAGQDSLEENYGIAIDLGTTTIAICLVGLTSKSIVSTYTAVNRQRAYGADVLSRIQASREGRKETLRQSIRKDLLLGIRFVTQEASVPRERIKEITIAGNTTMGHLLLGYSCDTLGTYPFTPVNIGTTVLTFHEVFGVGDLDARVTILPGISTFVGGDIVAGLLACDFDSREEPCLFIDLGTNGELAIGGKDRILVSSTAAGPAFEGGNISCGTGSITGAICSFSIQNDKTELDTIGHKPPIGICGTGAIELISELVRVRYVDETGLLSEEYFEKGYPVAVDTQGKEITFTQKDIREFQLAKSAVRTGMEILLKSYGITCQDVAAVYLAGGFGFKLNLEKAVHIGLLPKELSQRFEIVGNSSLTGAIRYLTEKTAKEKVNRLLKAASEIHLANDEDFNELYLRYISF